MFIFSPLVLPPVLVPRNPQVISSRYEPVPSYIDTQRPTCSPNHYHPFELPGKQFVSSLACLHNCLFRNPSTCLLRNRLPFTS